MARKKRKKKVEPICGNCVLYNQENSTCKLAILHEGKEWHIPVDPTDSCFFEEEFPDKEGGMFTPLDEVKQVRWFVEDPETGKPTKGDGVVKIEYPEGFFGEENEED